jgi:capsular polysaccharide transport system permease protein
MSEMTAVTQQASLLAGWQERRRVIGALILRESRACFGRNRLGFGWALVEPLAQVGVLGAMYEFLGRTGPNGIDSFAFLVCGIVPFNAFANTATRCMAAVDANRSLLSYPVVRPIDTVVARAALEAVVYTVVFAALLLVSLGLDQGRHMDLPEPLGVLFGFGGALLLGLGLGLSLAAGSALWPVVERLFPVVRRLLFFGSAIFYSLSMLPANAAALLSWNPLVHVNETVRAGMFSAFGGGQADRAYLGFWALALLAFGLAAFRTVESDPRARMRGGR